MVIDIDQYPAQPKHNFEDFFKNYEDNPNHFKYREAIQNAALRKKSSIFVLFEDILTYDPPLAELLREAPEETLREGVEAFKDLLKFYSGGKIDEERDYFIRIKTDNNSNEVNLRKLRAEHIDKLVYIYGILIRASQIIPQITIAYFECPVCQQVTKVDQVENALIVPKQCSNCKNKAGFMVTSKDSKFIDWQSIKIQELPEESQPGRVPYSIKGILTHDLVDKVRPGERVKITGVFKTFVNENSRGRKSTLFTPYLKVLSVEGKNAEDEELNISPEDEKEFRRLAAKPNIQEIIAKSIAPSILGLDHLKLAAGLSLFGGVRKELKDGSARRGDIHILFIGDPGTGKSVHGSEKIYVGDLNKGREKWKCVEIGNFVNDLMERNQQNVLRKRGTEILPIPEDDNFFTISIQPDSLKSQRSKIIELSRHHAESLVKIHTRSGRKVIVTPDHSFTSLKDGKLTVFTSRDLIIGSYLPIARRINFDDSDIINQIKISKIFDENEIVSARNIRSLILDLKSGKISKTEAYNAANMTPGKFRKYFEDLSSLPKGNWVRRIHDNSWFPEYIKLDEAFGRIIGLFLAEGNIEKTSVRISNTDADIKSIVFKDFLTIFDKKATIFDNGCILNQSSVAAWFKTRFSTGAEQKILPHEFITTPKTFRKALLSGYFTGDGWVEEKSGTINALTKSEKLAFSITDLLASLGIFASIKQKIIRKGAYKGNIYFVIKITGEDSISFYNQIAFLSFKKQENLRKAIGIWSNRSRYQLLDAIPSFGNLLKDIVDDLELKGKRGTWERKFKAELRGKTQRQHVGRKYLQKIVQKFKEIYNKQQKRYSDEFLWLEKISTSDIYWDKITHIESINEDSIVYDIGTTDGHFLIANGNLLVHNSQILKQCAHISPQAIYASGKGSSAAGLTAAVVRENDAAGLSLEAGALVLADGGNAIIDEFDKMDNRDRGAIHEAMEQQSYHPSTEILGTNGERLQIGTYVDNLMDENPNQIIPGVDCEIFFTSNLNLYSTDFKQAFKTRIDRVSRHSSPKSFIKFNFSNERSIIVTPEHPMYVIIDGEITTIPAESCENGMVIPAPSNLPDSDDPIKIEILDVKITDIVKIPNHGEYYTPWVYDVTVEPNHTFISQGVILHNTVSVAKAGIIATLRARTSIIAAANPKMGRYSEYKTPTENINLSPPILSRFDLIFVVKDEPNETLDLEIADFILDLNTQANQTATGSNKDPLIPGDVLQKYIKYARSKVFPKLSPDARKVIKDFYVELRKVNRNDENAAIAVVARNLEGFIRISEAYAKMALRSYVTKEDTEKALELAKRSLKDTSMDPITGKLDADRVLTGITTAQAKISGFLDALKQKVDVNGGKPIDEEEFITDLEFNKDIERSKIEKLLEKLIEEGTVYRPNPGKLVFSPDSESEKSKKRTHKKTKFP